MGGHIGAGMIVLSLEPEATELGEWRSSLQSHLGVIKKGSLQH